VQAFLAFRDAVQALPAEDFYYRPLATTLFQLSNLRQPAATAPAEVLFGDVMIANAQDIVRAGRVDLHRAALAVYQQAVIERPASSELWLYLARHYVDMSVYGGDAATPALAVEAFREAINRAPYQVVYRAELAELLGGLQRYDDALAEADASLRYDPVYWRTHYIRSLALHKLGRLPEAVAAANTAEANLNASYDPANGVEAAAVRQHAADLRAEAAGARPGS
jgi:tetratricopeptide (TPR) repeat protein